MNQPQLREYQLQAIAQLRGSIASGNKKIIVCIPTGGGKTTVAAEIIRGAFEKGSTVLFLAHRRELVSQAKGRLLEFGINSGTIMSGTRWRDLPVMVGSIQTLQRRELPMKKIVFVDECHHATSKTFKRLIDHYAEKGCIVIGLTATPEREDGSELGDVFDDMIVSTDIPTLIAERYLVPTRVIGVKMDLSQVLTKGKDYDTDSMYQSYNKAKIYDDVIVNYQKYAAGTKAIVFNVNVEHSIKTCKSFLDAGISAHHVDGEMPTHQRMTILNAFRRGEFQVLCNVNILTEGYDLPSIETVILNRATKSRSLYIQMVGRGLRPSAGKPFCTVIDHGNNTVTHGQYESYLPPPLVTADDVKKRKQKKEKQAAPVKECPGCARLLPLPTRECPECGHHFESTMEIEQAEFVEYSAEHLAEINEAKRKLRPELDAKHFREMTIEELMEVQEVKGYKLAWLTRQIASRGNKDVVKQHLEKVAAQRNYKQGWVHHNLKMIISDYTPSSL